MLGPDVNETYQKKYDAMMAGPNKFKQGDIITDFKDNLRSATIIPAKEWVRGVGGSITWRVNSVEPNGDYKLQRLDTLTTEPLKEKGSPRYLKEVTRNKEAIDYWSQYKIWDADYVKAIYQVGLDAMDREKKVHEENKLYIDTEIDELIPEINNYIKKKLKKKFEKKLEGYTIEEIYEKFHYKMPIAANKWSSSIGPGMMEFIWNMIDVDNLKQAQDYDFVKNELFGKDDNDYENFKIGTDVSKTVLTPKNVSAIGVLGNEDLHRTIEEYFRRSTKGGKKTKKGGQQSKKRRQKSKKRGRKTLLLKK